MRLKLLEPGSRGHEVQRWQAFLLGQGHYCGILDGKFGESTVDATRQFQLAWSLETDGIVGLKTLGRAIQLGYGYFQSAGRNGRLQPNLPLRPDFDPLPDTEARHKLFGQFDWNSTPCSDNPERIEILGDWIEQNIVKVEVPYLAGVEGGPHDGCVEFHRAAARQIQNLFESWKEAGILDRIFTWNGSFNARKIRGSRRELSVHAFGAAFDINANWNRFGALPAMTDDLGCVRELVGIANGLGFFWGGHFNRYPDGMHFEVSRLILPGSGNS